VHQVGHGRWWKMDNKARGRWWNWRVVTCGTKFIGGFVPSVSFCSDTPRQPQWGYSDFLSPPNNTCNLSIRNNGGVWELPHGHGNF
jgi:hypothetical protein